MLSRRCVAVGGGPVRNRGKVLSRCLVGKHLTPLSYYIHTHSHINIHTYARNTYMGMAECVTCWTSDEESCRKYIANSLFRFPLFDSANPGMVPGLKEFISSLKQSYSSKSWKKLTVQSVKLPYWSQKPGGVSGYFLKKPNLSSSYFVRNRDHFLNVFPTGTYSQVKKKCKQGASLPIVPWL